MLSWKQEAAAARKQISGYRLDKSHTFVVTTFDDFEKYVRVPDEYEAPEPRKYKPTVRSALIPNAS